MRVLLAPTGTANVASVLAGLRRVGGEPRVAESAAEVADADRLVLPGVGAFGAAMASLRRAGLVDVLRDRIAAGRPTLAICLGLQLLARESEESPGIAGLGVLDGAVTRLAAGVRVPQLGWNEVDSEGGLVEPGWAFFANSYRVAEAPPGWLVSRTDHGGEVVAAIQRGPVLACQFHPELSGPWGLALLRRWLEGPC